MDFENLLLMVGNKICKQETRFRATIPPSLGLAVTLRFLTSGESFTSLMYTSRISKQAISLFGSQNNTVKWTHTGMYQNNKHFLFIELTNIFNHDFL